MKISILVSAIFFNGLAWTQVGIYMSELIGRTYEYMYNGEYQEKRTYRFTDEDGDGWASGVQTFYRPNSDPDDPNKWITVYDMVSSFEIEQSDKCGNCMVFKMEDGIEKYFIVDHEVGNFWIQEVDENFNAVQPETIYYPEEKVGAPTIVAYSNNENRLLEWPEENPNDGGWIIPSKTGASFEASEASSTLPEDDNFSYEMENAFDDNPNTTWFSNPEGKENYPADEYIMFTGVMYDESLWILNGMQYSAEDFENNSRVKTAEIYIENELVATVEFLDVMGEQQVVIPGVSKYFENGVAMIQIVILEVYPGSEYPECGITEIYTKKSE